MSGLATQLEPRWDTGSTVVRVPPQQFADVYNASVASAAIVVAIAPEASWDEIPPGQYVSYAVEGIQTVRVRRPLVPNDSIFDTAMLAFSAGLMLSPIVQQAWTILPFEQAEANFSRVLAYGPKAAIEWPYLDYELGGTATLSEHLRTQTVWTVAHKLLKTATDGLIAGGMNAFSAHWAMEQVSKHILTLLIPGRLNTAAP